MRRAFQELESRVTQRHAKQRTRVARAGLGPEGAFVTCILSGQPQPHPVAGMRPRPTPAPAKPPWPWVLTSKIEAPRGQTLGWLGPGTGLQGHAPLPLPCADWARGVSALVFGGRRRAVSTRLLPSAAADWSAESPRLTFWRLTGALGTAGAKDWLAVPGLRALSLGNRGYCRSGCDRRGLGWLAAACGPPWATR